MAKKLSKFEVAFAEARKGGKKEFDFGGKKFNTKMKGEGASKRKSSLPKTAPIPTSRASAVSSMASKRPSSSVLSNVGSEKKGANPIASRTATDLPTGKTAMMARRNKADLDLGSRKPLKDSALFKAGKKLLKKKYR